MLGHFNQKIETFLIKAFFGDIFRGDFPLEEKYLLTGDFRYDLPSKFVEECKL